MKQTAITCCPDQSGRALRSSKMRVLRLALGFLPLLLVAPPQRLHAMDAECPDVFLILYWGHRSPWWLLHADTLFDSGSSIEAAFRDIQVGQVEERPGHAAAGGEFVSVIRVLFVEASSGGVVGGSLTGLCHLIGALDRGRFAPAMVLYESKSIETELGAIGVPVSHVARLFTKLTVTGERLRSLDKYDHSCETC